MKRTLQLLGLSLGMIANGQTFQGFQGYSIYNVSGVTPVLIGAMDATGSLLPTGSESLLAASQADANAYWQSVPTAPSATVFDITAWDGTAMSLSGYNPNQTTTGWSWDFSSDGPTFDLATVPGFV